MTGGFVNELAASLLFSLQSIHFISFISTATFLSLRSVRPSRLLLQSSCFFIRRGVREKELKEGLIGSVGTLMHKRVCVCICVCER